MQALFLLFAFFSGLVNAAPGGGPINVGYYADWTATKLTPEAVPYQKLTHLNYAFATVDQTGKINLDTTATLQKVVAQAHQHNVKALLSVGGWTGSRYFSTVAKDQGCRAAFVQNCKDFIQKYNLDGIDIDWEFPGETGLACNAMDAANDVPNFVLLLQELRAAVGHGKLISLATRISPFKVNGQVSPDNNKKISQYVDHINVMSYDINGAWSDTFGANAPLDDGTANCYAGAAKAWNDAGFPNNKIVMGIPAYGRSLTLASPLPAGDSPFGKPIKKNIIPKGDSDDAEWADSCPGSAATFSGVWQWKNLVPVISSLPSQPGSDWVQGRDQKSNTPWLCHKTDQNCITYDDPKSIHAKIQYSLQQRHAGFMVWALHQDATGPQGLISQCL